MRVFNAPGLACRNPASGRLIPDDGIEVGPHDLDLARMIAEGDLVEERPADPPSSRGTAKSEGATR